MNNRFFVSLIVAVVIGTAAYGLWLAGSPMSERARRIDAQRISDLQQISYNIDRFWTTHQRLPTSLDELARERDSYIQSIHDPETRTPYEFTLKMGDTYELCATFAAQAYTLIEKNIQPQTEFPRVPTFWNHAAGRSCFTINVIKPPAVKL